MAGDWIKVCHRLPIKKEIDTMASRLSLDHDAVVGKLVRFWIWLDQESKDGNDVSVTEAFLDRLTNCPGFANALLEVDWLQARSGSFAVPRFARHNGPAAKNRALSADRMKRFRRNESVTESSQRAHSPPLSSSNSLSSSEKKKFQKPSEEEVRAFCQEKGYGVEAGAFVAFYESNGWRVGKNAMRDWRAAVRTWETRNGTQRSKAASGEELFDGLKAFAARAAANGEL